MGRGGGGGGSRGGGGRSGGSRGGSSRSSSSSGRGRSSFSSGRSSYRPSSGGYRSSYRPTRYRSYGGGSASRGGCLGGTLGTLVAILIVIVALYQLVGGGLRLGSTTTTRSTIEREKLDKQYCTVIDEWFDDSAMGWIASASELESGLKDFYNETGVQPYLVITDTVYGDSTPTGDDVWEYANEVYDQMFTDEGHMVFVFQCPDGGVDYTMAACTGAQAKTVLDEDEALEILYDQIDYYFYTDYDEDEMFARAFSDAGEKIMTVQKSPVVTIVAIVGGVVALIVVFKIIKSVNKRKKEEAAETERILNTPVEKFGDTSLDDLKNKYD